MIDAIRAAWRCQAFYSFFASEHALLPAGLFRLFGRRVVLTTGGYDTANDQTHGYGLAATSRGWLPRLVIALSTSVLPMSNAALEELLALSPRAARKARMVYLATTPEEWCDPGVPRRANRVVTCGAMDAVSVGRKGIDRFLKVAHAAPDLDFVLLGDLPRPLAASLFPAGPPPNVRVTGVLPHRELVREFWSATAYCQLSWHEGFGMAMAEAMLCGCTPVISCAGALPEIAGSWAEVSSHPDDDLGAIRRALSLNPDRTAMRRQVATRFPLQARRRELLRAMLGLRE